MLERNTVYGMKLFKPYEVTVASLNDRNITVVWHSYANEKGQFVARSRVNGNENCQILEIKVDMGTNSWGLPRPNFIEIWGLDLKSGELVYEKKIH
jgi:hypothetical protein